MVFFWRANIKKKLYLFLLLKKFLQNNCRCRHWLGAPKNWGPTLWVHSIEGIGHIRWMIKHVWAKLYPITIYQRNKQHFLMTTILRHTALAVQVQIILTKVLQGSTFQFFSLNYLELSFKQIRDKTCFYLLITILVPLVSLFSSPHTHSLTTTKISQCFSVFCQKIYSRTFVPSVGATDQNIFTTD